MNVFKRLRKAETHWLEQLAKENEKNFSGRKIDCRSLE